MKTLKNLLLIIYTSIFVIINEFILIKVSNWYYINVTYQKIKEGQGDIMPPTLLPGGDILSIFSPLNRYSLFSYILIQFCLLSLFFLSIAKLKNNTISYKKISTYSLLISLTSYLVLSPLRVNSILALAGVSTVNTVFEIISIILHPVLILLMSLVTLKYLFISIHKIVKK